MKESIFIVKEDYFDSFKGIVGKSRFYNRDFTRKILEQNKILKLFKIDKVDLFYFFEYPLNISDSLIEKYVKEIPPLSHVMYVIDYIFKKIRKKEINKIISNTRNFEINEILSQICKKEKIKFIKNKNSKGNFKLKTYLLKNYIKTRFFFRRILYLLKFRERKIEDVVFITNDRFNKIKRKENSIYGNIIKRLDKEKIPITLLEYDKLENLNSIFSMIKKNFSKDYDSLHICRLNDRGMINYRKRFYRKIINLYKIINKKNIRYKYKDIDLTSLFKKRLFFIFYIVGLFTSDLYATRKKISSAKIIITDSEKNYLAKMINLLKNSEYKTLSIEWDELNDYRRVYSDYKLVSGSNMQKFLIKTYQYPKNRIIITGSPRYDTLKYIKENIRKKLNISNNKKIILFCSQIREDERIIKELSDIKKDNEFIIYKLHPRDPNLKKYQKSNKKNFLITKDLNTSELIKASDIMITIYSATALEAILLNKNVILYNPEKKYDILSYVKEGSALLATNKDELRTKIDEALNNTKTIKKMQASREISQRLHNSKNDGKASKRIVKIIKKALR